MFTSQATKKIFQKPNILRKKPKPKQGAQKFTETLDDNPLTSARTLEVESASLDSKTITRELFPLLDHEAKSVVVGNAAECTNESGQPSQEVEEKYIATKYAKLQNGETTSEISNPSDEMPQDDEEVQGSLNIESFLVGSPNKQIFVMTNDTSSVAKKMETEVERKWCLNFMSDNSKDVVTPTFYEGAQISKVNTDISTNQVSFSNKMNSSQALSVLEQDIIQSCLTTRVVKYKCDMPNCSKSFWNEARLQKHQAIHSRKKSNSIPITVDCPVTKVDSAGIEQRCGQSFPSRDILMKHLKGDHVPEDAAHRCFRCGRRFWWATGMRTHAQTACTRALACTWSGCGRVFRQPCRLREHARAHTGDRPYPCDYPNCGWAFRSASKLVRHARRHTGERKHECAACGRAFPRREHLRDHAARHHARDPTPCTYEGCEETFANTSSLFLHLKRAHRPEGSKPPPRRQRPSKKKAPADMIVMNFDGGASLYKYDGFVPGYTTMADAIETANASAMIMPEAEVDNDFTALDMLEEVEEVTEEVAEEEVEEEVEEVHGFGYDLKGRCARTHCTWPLQRMPVIVEPAFTIEEDAQVEASESSESNIYTVRSDLFLHGNVLINEDSEFTIRESSNRAASEAEEASNTGQLDGLDLINSHPTIDLMQEELMYDDAAVDESSFRVFLMNAEELT